MSLTTVFLMLLVLYLSPESVTTASGQVQTADAVRSLKGGAAGQCPSVEERERERNELNYFVTSVIANTTSAPTMPTMTTMYTCNGTPGWRRVAFINMTDTNYNCPTGFSLTSYSKRTCGRSRATCTSTAFGVGDLPYSRVCGRIRGYQYGSTSAFGYSSQSQSIDGYYVDGMTLTYGIAGNRRHIWTFAAGLTAVGYHFEDCPCANSRYDQIPTFIGDDYFCESGLHSNWNGQLYSVFFNNVLWDGQNCTSTSTCCQFNNPPWFTKNLTNATTDDIELRLCTNNPYGQEDIPIELIELYVQ